jgi:hypothetical protein
MALSQTAIGSRSIDPQPIDYKIPTFKNDLNEMGNLGKVTDRQMVDAFIDTIRTAIYSFYGNVTPVTYEPTSNTLVEVQEWRYMSPQNELHGGIYIKYSTNNGLTWGKRTFWDEAGKLPLWPSIAVLNPGKTNPIDFNYVIQGPVAVQEGQQYPWKGGFWLLVNGTASADPLVIPGPTNGYTWWTTRAAANKVGNKEMFYNSSILTNQSGYQYGAYGNSAFDMKAGDFLIQNIPPQWDVSVFRPSTDPTRSYNDQLYTDVDNQGGVYVGVKNMFADDINSRVPSVSKSVDGGLTWSAFDRMPKSLIENYIDVYGGDAQRSGMVPYNSDGFVVWGPDNFSFLFRMAIGTSSNQYEFHIVEASKRNGAWGIRKVGDYSGYNLIAVTDEGDQTNYKDSVSTSRLGNELQIVRTADSKYVIAKWVDYNGDTMRVMPPIIMNEVDTIGIINTTDVFMAYRDVNNPDWSQTFNVTKTKDIDKCTFLPMVVRNLATIPLFSLASFRSQYQDPNHPRNQYPGAVWQLLYDTWQGVGFTKVALDVNDVKEETYNFNVNDIYPNPVSDAAEVSFNFDATSNVSIQVFDILGNKRADVINTILSQGMHGINIDVNDYESGNYYVRITVGGQSITKSMTVVH